MKSLLLLFLVLGVMILLLAINDRHARKVAEKVTPVDTRHVVRMEMSTEQMSTILAAIIYTNCYEEPCSIWTNNAGDETMIITHHGAVFFRVLF
jgi:hypothetical protein